MSAVVAGDRLKKALSRSAREAGISITHVAEKTSPWSSCSFVGGRHEVTISADPGEQLGDWLEGLNQDSFTVPGYVLADLLTTTVEHAFDRTVATIDAMTIEEA